MNKILWMVLLVLTGINAEIMSLNDANYKEQIAKHKKTVLLFEAPWCGACRSMKPTYETFASTHKEETFFAKINTDDNENATSVYKIESLPTLVFLENGREIKRTSGTLDTDELELFVYTEKVMKKYMENCNAGKSEACSMIGELYEEGEVVKKDYAKALTAYEKSCTLGNAKGCMYLAYMYDEAMGVKQNYTIAIKYYKKACDGENIIACRFLGYFYDEGLGAKKDYKKAHELYLKSCKGEDEYACYNLGYMYSEGNGVAKDLKKAFDFYSLGCEFGNDDSCKEADKLK
jgi:thioredoxin